MRHLNPASVPLRVVTVTVEELAALVEAAVLRALESAPTSRPAAGEWLDAGEAADLLGVHRRTIGKFAKAGTLRASRCGKLWRILRVDVEAMLAKGAAG